MLISCIPVATPGYHNRCLGFGDQETHGILVLFLGFNLLI